MADFQSFSFFQPTPTPETTSNEPQVTVSGITTRITLNGGNASQTSDTATSYSTSEIPKDIHGDSWKATARTATGTPARTVTSDSVVTINGINGRVSDFVAAGALYEVTPGQFSDTPPEWAASTEQRKQDTQNQDAAVMPDEVSSAVNEALEPFSDSVLASGVAQVTLALTGEASLEEVALSVARSSGIEPSEAQARIEFVTQAYEQQTAHHLGKTAGLSPEDLQTFYSDLKAANKSGLQEAIGQQVNANSMAVWSKLADQWMRDTPPTVEAIERAGLQTRGGTEVQLNGSWMSIKAAARAGLI